LTGRALEKDYTLFVAIPILFVLNFMYVLAYGGR
jgi:hypothetical protein